MTTKIITIELNDKQMSQYREWCSNLRKIFGDIGEITWSIKLNGIGETVSVLSSHAPQNPLNLTDIDSW